MDADQQLWEQAMGIIPTRAPSDPVKVCQSKNRYATKEFAERLAQRGRTNQGWRISVYHCDVCDGWHLTKRPQGQGK